MANGDVPGQLTERSGVKMSATWPMLLWQWISRPSLDRDSRALLPPMLQRVQPQIGQIGGLGMAVNGENAAFFVEVRRSERDNHE